MFWAMSISDVSVSRALHRTQSDWKLNRSLSNSVELWKVKEEKRGEETKQRENKDKELELGVGL